VARLDSGVPARDALECAYARRTEIRPPSGWRRPPGRPRQTWLHQIVDGSTASIHQEWTLQSDVDISNERDRRYGPPPPKRSDDEENKEKGVKANTGVVPHPKQKPNQIKPNLLKAEGPMVTNTAKSNIKYTEIKKTVQIVRKK